MTPSTTKAVPHTGLSSEQLRGQRATTIEESMLVDQFVKDGQAMVGALERCAPTPQRDK